MDLEGRRSLINATINIPFMFCAEWESTEGDAQLKTQTRFTFNQILLWRRTIEIVLWFKVNGRTAFLNSRRSAVLSYGEKIRSEHSDLAL